MKSILSILGLGITLATAANAQSDGIWFDKTKIAELHVGLLCNVVVTGSEPAPDTIAGEIQHIAGDMEFVWRGLRVPTILGLTFGIQSRALDGQVLGSVEMKTTHPPFGPNNTTVERWTSEIGADVLSTRAYTFDYDYEMVPGIWTFEAYAKGDLLYHVEFEVVDPSDAPVQANICNGNSLTS